MATASTLPASLDLIGDLIQGVKSIFAPSEKAEEGIRSELGAFIWGIATPLRKAKSKAVFEQSFRIVAKRNVVAELERLTRKQAFKELLREQRVNALKPQEQKEKFARNPPADELYRDVEAKFDAVKPLIRKARAKKGFRKPTKSALDGVLGKVTITKLALLAASVDDDVWELENLWLVWEEGISAVQDLVKLFRVGPHPDLMRLTVSPISRSSVVGNQDAIDLGLGLNDESMEKSWSSAMALLKSREPNPSAFMSRAASSLSAWRNSPSVTDEVADVSSDEV